jgi:hypothetical protein
LEIFIGNSSRLLFHVVPENVKEKMFDLIVLVDDVKEG